jgi:hypothetical protein
MFLFCSNSTRRTSPPAALDQRFPLPRACWLVTVGPDLRSGPIGLVAATWIFLLNWVRKGLALIRGAPRTFTDDEQHTIARAIVEDLEKANWKIKQGPPAVRHGSELMGPRK